MPLASPQILPGVAGVTALAAASLAALSAVRIHIGAQPAPRTNAAAGLCVLALALTPAAGIAVPVSAILGAIGLAAAAIAFIDTRTFVIPDGLVVCLAALAIAAPFSPPLAVQAAGAIAVGGTVYVVRTLHRMRRGEEGVGMGDVKLAAALGALLGPTDGCMALGSACALAACLAIARRSAGGIQSRGAIAVPLGAPLALALVAGVCARVLGAVS